MRTLVRCVLNLAYWGCLFDGWETSLSGVRQCAHTGLNPVACYVFVSRGLERVCQTLRHIAGWSQGTLLYQMIRAAQFV